MMPFCLLSFLFLSQRGAGIANTYQRRADILNRGMSGYNTTWYLRYAQDNGVWHEGRSNNGNNDNSGNGDEIVLIILFFGANDASIEEYNPHAYVSLDDYTNNLRTLIDKCQLHYKNARIIIITPPPVHHEQRLIFQKQRYGEEKATGILERTLDNTSKYATACKNVATNEYNLPCLDLFHTMQQDPNPKEGKDDDEKTTTKESSFDFGIYFHDGLHFSPQGHEFVYQSLLQLIETQVPTLHVTKDKYTGQWNNSGTTCGAGLISSGPYHDSINHTCYNDAFDKDYQEKYHTNTTNGNDDDEPEPKRQRHEEEN